MPACLAYLHIEAHSGVVMAMAHEPMFDIRKYLGHSDTSVTVKRYAKVHPDYLKEAGGLWTVGPVQ